MKKLLASMALAGAAVAVAAPAQAATVDLTFGAPSLESANVYRYSNVMTGVDLLLELTGTSAQASVTEVTGNSSFYTGANDNLRLSVTRPANSGETDTFVDLKFTFVDAGTTNAAIVNDVVLTFGDIDSHPGLSFSDYVQFDASQFSSVIVGSELSSEAGTVAGTTRYLGSYDQTNYEYTSTDQTKVSLAVEVDGISSFTATWGYIGEENVFDRAMLLDGSNELQQSVVPEPASASLLGLGALALLARRRRR